MKCALCGAEWLADHDGGGKTFLWHPICKRHLSEVCVSVEVSEAINAAIEAAKEDKRDPEKCTHHNKHYMCDFSEGKCVGPCAEWKE